jgi:transposase
MKIFYERLKNKGKPSKVALTAVMRKLLIMLNSIVKRQTPWVKNLQLNSA